MGNISSGTIAISLNLIQGITSPLTFSYIIKLYEKVYRQFVALMGVSPKAIERNAEGFAHMLGFLNGRIYYNLRSWYKMIAMLPGYSFNARFMEQMMGVKERFDLDPEEKAFQSWVTSFG